jgi:hypothetical protein
MGLPNRDRTFSYMFVIGGKWDCNGLGDNWLACVEGVTLARNANQTQTNRRPTPIKRQATQTKRQSNAKQTQTNLSRSFLSII